MNKNQELFTSLALYFSLELHNQADEKVLNIQKDQKKNRDSLLDDIAKILLSYTVINSSMSLTLGDNKKLYSKLGKKIDDIIMNELKNEANIMKDLLSNTCLEKYSTNNYIYSFITDFKLTQLSDEALNKIISTKVEDKLWSDRLYDNKNQIAKTLRNEVKKFLKGETNVNEIEKVIKDKYNTNAHETKRLVQDNICRVQEGANDVWQHEHDIKDVMYSATLDGKVCSKCAPYDTKVYELDKKPVQIPQHPFCRCVYISLVNKEWKPKMRRDNITKENINWTTYQEWFDSQEP